MSMTGRPALAILLTFVLGAAALALAWWLPNRPQALPEVWQGEKFASASFAPYRLGQDPLTKRFPSQAEVAEDVATAARSFRTLRTYSVGGGLQYAPEAARRHGVELWLGLWLSPNLADNEEEVEGAIRFANQYRDVVTRVVVGNEVLLRRDLPVDRLAAYIRRVKAAVPQPVTFADVWEFWLRHPQLAQEVDIVTVHFLPYWEDDPIGVAHSMEHVRAIYRKVKQAFPDKPVAIGEVGWPSRGRSREAATPSRFDQAWFLNAFVNLAEREGFDYNLIEAFDQPWKSKLEGTVGANWGLFDAERLAKFPLAGPIVEDPLWPIWASISVILALAVALYLMRLAPAPSNATLAMALGGLLAGLLGAAVREAWLTWHDKGWIFWPLAWVGLQALLAAHMIRVASAGRRDFAQPTLIVLFALLALYETVLLGVRPDLQVFRDAVETFPNAVNRVLFYVFNGRYRDFPIDEFLVPVAAVVLALVRSGPLPRVGKWLPAGMLVFVALMLWSERFANVEAWWWAAMAAVLALPGAIGRGPRGAI